MNEKFTDDDVLLDRLVDGELSDDERRQLLASLDDRPDGWRRCALVFLEAQCWREQLGEFLRQPVHGVTEANPIAQSNALSKSRSAWRGMPRSAAWLSIAAGLLVAFALGTIWQHSAQPVPGTPLAEHEAPKPAGELAQVMPQPSLPEAEPVGDELTLYVRDREGRARAVHVPLVDAHVLDEQLGLQFRPGVPQAVRSALENRGFNVQSKRRYAPLWLENGRPMIVPVEDTRIVPRGRDL